MGLDIAKRPSFFVKRGHFLENDLFNQDEKLSSIMVIGFFASPQEWIAIPADKQLWTCNFEFDS